MVSVKEIFRSYAVFDADGRHVNGTDKESNHRYGDAYEKLLDRESVQLMMEVGIADGSSLLAWRDVFPNALCVGMDIHHSDRAHGDRLEFHLGDQRSKEDCERAAAGRQFDLIVEDATHQLTDTLLTLLYLWPFVRRNGFYVVEEFANAGALRNNLAELWMNHGCGCCGDAVSVQLVDTVGPFGGVEPLVVFRKP